MWTRKHSQASPAKQMAWCLRKSDSKQAGKPSVAANLVWILNSGWQQGCGPRCRQSGPAGNHSLHCVVVQHQGSLRGLCLQSELLMDRMHDPRLSSYPLTTCRRHHQLWGACPWLPLCSGIPTRGAGWRRSHCSAPCPAGSGTLPAPASQPKEHGSAQPGLKRGPCQLSSPAFIQPALRFVCFHLKDTACC